MIKGSRVAGMCIEDVEEGEVLRPRTRVADLKYFSWMEGEKLPNN